MGLFSRKKRVPLSEIIDALLTALNDAREMQELRQNQLTDSLTDAETDEPVVKRLKIGDQEIEIPLYSLLSRDSMEIKEVNVSFQVQIKDLAARVVTNNTVVGNPLTYEDLRFLIEKAEEIVMLLLSNYKFRKNEFFLY